MIEQIKAYAIAVISVMLAVGSAVLPGLPAHAQVIVGVVMAGAAAGQAALQKLP